MLVSSMLGKLSFQAIFLILFCNTLFAGTPDLLRPNSILQVEAGARSHGMGNANTGRADDLSGMFYNPAGLSLMGYAELGFDHIDFGEQVYGSALMAAVPIGDAMLAANYSNYYVRENENVADGLMVNPYQNLQAYHVGLSTGFGIYRRYIHGGFGIRYFSSTLNGENGLPQEEQGISFDFGLLARYNLKKLGGGFFFLPEVSGGLAIKNISTSFGLSNYTAQNPLQINLGASLYYAYSFLLNFDIINGPEQVTEYRAGFEYWPVSFLALRSGVGQQAAGDQAVNFHWGLGIGEKAGPGKLSFEYAGAEYRSSGFLGSRETRHRFALHYSFENIRSVREPNGRVFRIPIAFSHRYSSRLRFANFQEPGEIIDQIIQSLIPAPAQSNEVTVIEPPDPGIPDEPVVVPGGEDPQPFVPDPVKVYKLAVFPIQVKSTSDENFENDIGTEVRDSQLSMAESVERLDLMRENRYKLTPWREDREDYIAYLRRICKFHRVELLVFSTITFDSREDIATMKMIFFRKADDMVTAQSEYSRPTDQVDELIELGTRELRLQAATIFDYQESES